MVILGTALVAVALWLGDYGKERDVYIVTTSGSVSGLYPESTVIYRGVLAGKVIGIEFDPDDTHTILVRIEIDKGLPITKGTYATLRIQGLTGLAQVELNDSGEDSERLTTDASHPTRIPLTPSLIDKLTETGQDLLPQLTQLAARLNALTSDKNRNQLHHILKNVNTFTQQLVKLDQRLEEEFANLSKLSATADWALTEFAEMAKDVKKTSQDVRALTEAAHAVALSGKGAGDTLINKTLPQVNALLVDMQRTVVRLGRLSNTLEDDPQALLIGRPPTPPGPGEPGFGAGK